MTNVEALKALYAALGGDPADVADAVTIVDVLNAIAAMYEGADDATLNPDAIANIAAVADNIGGGGDYNGLFVAEPYDDFAAHSLVEVNIPTGIVKISEIGDVFNMLERVTIPDTVKNIDAMAFQGTELKSINIPESVTMIGYSAFEDCPLEEITIPSSIEGSNMGGSAFKGCYMMKTATINNDYISGSQFANCESLKTVTISENIETIEEDAFTGCAVLETITINKPEGSISGAPWGAPETTQIIWNG